MQYLSLLDNVSPMVWLTAAVALAVLELASRTGKLIYAALSGFTVFALLSGYSGMNGQWQVGIFLGLSVLFAMLGPVLFRRLEAEAAETQGLRSKDNSPLAGLSGVVVDFAKGEGIVAVAGQRWRAHWTTDAEAAPGDMIRVVGHEGAILHVEAAYF